MTIEEKLKEYILTQYKSLREFATFADIPYTTVFGILKRGVHNASIGNIIRICQTLNIDADELAKDKIVPLSAPKEHQPVKVEINDLIWTTKKGIYEFDEITLDGVTMTRSEIDTFLDSIDMGLEMIRRSRRRSW